MDSSITNFIANLVAQDASMSWNGTRYQPLPDASPTSSVLHTFKCKHNPYHHTVFSTLQIGDIRQMSFFLFGHAGPVCPPELLIGSPITFRFTYDTSPEIVVHFTVISRSSVHGVYTIQVRNMENVPGRGQFTRFPVLLQRGRLIQTQTIRVPTTHWANKMRFTASSIIDSCYLIRT